LKLVDNRTKTRNKIILEDSLFSNLNYGEGIHGLRKKDDSLLNVRRDKGIILNVDGFEGDISLMQNEFT